MMVALGRFLMEDAVPDLHVSLLGTPLVEVDGRPLQVDTRKAVALLAYLAVEGRPQSRETLAALLWPDSDDAGARAALRRTLSSLRAGLHGRWLIVDRQVVGLQAPDAGVDVQCFRELAERHRGHGAQPCEACLGDLSAATALYQGDLLNGFTLRDSPEFEDWQFAASEGLRDLLAQTLDTLVEACAGHGRTPEALAFARRRLALDPLHEATHRAIMRLHAAAGDRTAALTQYRECVRILDEELGVQPLQETTRLYQEILAPPPTNAVPELAVPIDAQTVGHGKDGEREVPLVGRERELQALLRLHASAANGGLAVIGGEAGIGKTRLASELLRRLQDEGCAVLRSTCYEGEQHLAFAPIIGLLRAGLATGNGAARVLMPADLAEASRLAPSLLDGAGLGSPGPLDSPAAQTRFFEGVCNVIAGLVAGEHTGAVLIDDVHWADEASLDLITFLARRLRDRPLYLVLTWRDEEVGAGHRLRRFAAERVREGGSLHLKLERLDQSSVRRLLELTHMDGEVDVLAARLFRETEGLPFFIVQYLASLREGNDGAAMPAGIRDLLLSRLARVADADLQVMSAAAVIGRSFGFETVRATSARSDEETMAALERLTRQGLLRSLEGSDASYDFSHEKLRALVYGETGLPRRRHLHGRAAEALVRGARRDHGAVVAEVARHYRLAGRDAEAAGYFKLAGESAWSLRANAEALAHYQAALACGHPSGSELHERIGELHVLAGDYPAALTSFQVAASLAQPERLSIIEHQIGGVYLRLGAWALAEEHLAGALRQAGDAHEGWLARVLTDQCLSAHRQGRAKEARDLAERALRLAENGEDALALAQSCNVAGILASGRGCYDAALSYLGRSLDAAAQMSDLGPGIAARNNLALVLRAQNRLDAAEAMTLEALALCRQQGDRHREAALHNNLADLWRAMGREDESMLELKAAVAIFAEIGTAGGTFEPEIWKLVEW